MIMNDSGINVIRRKVGSEVCRLEWEGNLDQEHVETLIREISPGPKPLYRCCIYKEREIVRGRVRLASGCNAVPGNETKNVVQVIEAACDDCPISSYTVTDNCRFCLGKACLKSCKFGAISLGPTRMHIDPAKCKECGMCAKSCPFGAIVHLERPCKKACPVDAISYDEYGFCQIDEEKCIHCGHCIHNCPFGAIGAKSFLTNIIRDIKAGKEVYAMCAPASEGQFGKDIGMASIKAAVKKLGFTDMVEVGLGGDMTAAYEAKEWIEARKEGRKMTTSCCPAFISMLRHNFPKQYEENKSSTVSPMVAVSRYLKAIHPGCVTVFIGPCIAKKGETLNEFIADRPNYAITFHELSDLMKSKGIEFEPVPEDYQESSIYGKKFATSGGVAAAVLEVMDEMGEDISDISLMSCAGGAECKKALMMLKSGRLKEDFIEGMMCPGGCVGGPSRQKTDIEISRARDVLLKRADTRKILDNLKNYPMDKFSMFRDGHMEE
ncbi:MAG: 4Fe-4S dicluster domain-containing protein [Lachnospiraceae bacterium]|nr:4Fe-4S dicluster domain-containing protein [Lachnospiraceae bacterium]